MSVWERRVLDPDLAIVAELQGSAAGRTWLQSLPGMVAQLAAEWELSVHAPFASGAGAWKAPVTTTDGVPAVLKISWPHDEARGEAVALQFWDGEGAVRVLRADPQRWALLLERCEPGTSLDAAAHDESERLAQAAQLLHRLWERRPPPSLGLDNLAVVAHRWATTLPGRNQGLDHPLDAGLVRLAVGLLQSLPRSASRVVLVHGDFNPGNILAAQRAPWLAIAPKPMMGDGAYDPWPLLTQVGVPASGNEVAAVDHRYEEFAALVDLPAERLLAWSVARAVESAVSESEAGRNDRGRRYVDQAVTLARLAGLT